MSLKKILSNPWVLGGGALIGIVILLSGKGGNGGTAQADTTTATLSSIALANDMNKAGLAFAGLQAQVAGEIAIENLHTNAGTFATFMASLMHLNDVNTLAQANIVESNAGVFSAMALAQTANDSDAQMNANRLAMGTLEPSSTLDDLKIQNGKNRVHPGLVGQVSPGGASVTAMLDVLPGPKTILPVNLATPYRTGK